MINSENLVIGDRQSDLFYRSLFVNNPDMVIFMDGFGAIVNVNESFLNTLGYSKREVELTPLEKKMSTNEVCSYKELFHKALQGEKQHTYTQFLHINGNEVVISLYLLPAMNGGRVHGVFGIAKDIRKLKQSELELEESKLKFSRIVGDSLIGSFIIQEDGKVAYGNRKFYEMLGVEDDKSEVNFLDYIHTNDIARLHSLIELLLNDEKGLTHSFQIVRKDGTVLDVESHATIIPLQNKLHMVGTLHDVTERKKTEKINEYLAHYDQLTGLPNQRLLTKILIKELELCKEQKQPLALMVIDLDRFKYLNDSLGHPIGNKLIKSVSDRLKSCLTEKDILSREGGDEFSIVLPNVGNREQVVNYAEKIIAQIAKPFFIETHEIFITASMGISIFPHGGEDVETLYRHADSALYKAKENGKNTYYIFTSSMDAESYKRFTLESDLRKATDLGQLELYYQPKICMYSFEIIGAEALIRWNHPKWGLVSPGEFIPIAEETGMILEIEKWIKETVSKQIKVWQNAGLLKIPISINISTHRFLQKDLLVNLKRVLEKTKLDPQYLQIEIVESSILENGKEVLSILEELKKLGVKVFLDDFGTGYSSLSYLKRFKGKIDRLKIDQSFISDLSRANEENSNFITKTIIDLAHHLKMEVVAEGVETMEQLEILQEFQCNIIQGYLFSKPVPVNEFTELLRKGRMEPQCQIE